MFWAVRTVRLCWELRKCQGKLPSVYITDHHLNLISHHHHRHYHSIKIFFGSYKCHSNPDQAHHQMKRSQLLNQFKAWT